MKQLNYTLLHCVTSNYFEPKKIKKKYIYIYYEKYIMQLFSAKTDKNILDESY